MTPATPSGGFRARLQTDLRAALVVLIVCSGALTITQTSSNAQAILFEGATFERWAAEGDVHPYEAVLTAGDFLEVSVSQDQFPVSLSIRGADGGVLRTISLPAMDPLPQRLMFVAPLAGAHRLEMKRPKARDINPAPRPYTLHVIALRAATADDRERDKRFQVLERASALAHLESMDGLRQAIPLLREVAAEWRAVDDVTLEVSTLESLAKLTAFFTRFHLESIAARERLSQIYPRTEEREREIANWYDLATEYEKDGRFLHAKQAVSRSLEVALARGLREPTARTQRKLGYFEFELGNYEAARTLAQQAHDLAVSVPAPVIEAMATWDLARLDELAGDLDAAIARNRRALPLASANLEATGLILMSLGFTHLQRGDLDEATSRFDARLAMSPTLVLKDHEAVTRLGLGDVSLARGNREDARQRYQAAASALERGNPRHRCVAEQRLGRLDLDEGHFEQSRVRFETMLEIATRINYSPCEAEARAGLADVAARSGDLESADTQAQRVVALTESFREAAASLESRALGFGALAPAYERAIDISMRRAERGDAGSIARALTLNEQALARGLLDRVAETRLDTTARVPAALATDHQQVRERWRARLAELQIAMRNSPDAPKTKALVDETRLLALQVRDLEARIDTADPRHATFVRPQPLDVTAMQTLLDDDTLFLEYALGDERSYLWVVSAHDIRAFTLAPRAAIEGLARRVHERLGRSPAAAKAREAGRPAPEADRRALSRLVLEPAAALLGERRLVVIPTGALSLVPFGALPAPGAPAGAPPLIEHHEIVQIPSATILQAMRAVTPARARPTKTAAIFADPVYQAHDARVRSASPADRGHQPPALTLARLPFSRNEASAIASLAPGGATLFVGAEATRERALDRSLADYRFLHFATHSVVDEDVPSLSSIALSMVDRSGRPRDGFVMLPDVYDMTLNADLVVLSGCQTALGKNVRGEGSIGLARGFMYAGVPRVVASLWQVSDLGTAELMKRFYRGMLVDSLTPAAALRAAQRELAANPRWASPYFWAPFILQGDWR